MRHILCYGDSNTFGTDPVNGGRHPDTVRWTGVLQDLLGSGYRVIEEGCGGRTTVFEDQTTPGRNGLMSLTTCISSHNPLDLVIVMLGTNDLKSMYNVTSWDLGRAMERIIKTIQKYDYMPSYPEPQILIISPVYIKEGISESPYGCFTEAAVELSHSFAQEYEAVADAYGCYFLDAALYAEASEEDRLHMNAENHLRLGQAVTQKVKSIFDETNMCT